MKRSLLGAYMNFLVISSWSRAMLADVTGAFKSLLRIFRPANSSLVFLFISYNIDCFEGSLRPRDCLQLWYGLCSSSIKNILEFVSIVMK